MIPLARDWWTYVVRGTAAVIFGVLTLLLPRLALVTLVMMWGVFALADGVTHLIAFVRHSGRGRHRRWGILIGALLSIVAGLIALAVPDITAIALLYIIAGWALLNGVIAIVAAIQLRKLIHNEWVLALSGVLSIIFASILALFPGPGALAVTIWIGAFAVVSGVMLVALGVRVRKRAKQQDNAAPFGASAIGV